MLYKLLALDLDGTLVDFTGQITPLTKSEVLRVAMNGTKIVIATGRSFQTALPFVREIGELVPMILFHGGLVVDEKGVPMRRLLLSSMIVEEILQWAQEYDVGPVLFSGQEIYAQELRLSPAQNRNFFGKRLAVVSNLSEKANRLVDKVILIGSEVECDAVYPPLMAHFSGRTEVTRSWRYFLEITPLGATKGAALAWFADRLGIQQNEVMAIGDASNDLSMVSWAGVGVAIGDGVPDLVAAADCVVPSVEENGLAIALRQFFP